MAYITYDYYSKFGGSKITENEFNRIAEIASDIINSVIYRPVNIDNEEQLNLVKKATSYQVELIYEQGGIDSIVGFAGSTAVGSESLGGYSVSNATDNKSTIMTINGVPVSPLTISLLKKAGLMTRWAYYRRE